MRRHCRDSVAVVSSSVAIFVLFNRSHTYQAIDCLSYLLLLLGPLDNDSDFNDSKRIHKDVCVMLRQQWLRFMISNTGKNSVFFSVLPTLIRPTPVTRRPCVNEISCQIFYNLQTSSCPWHKWTIWYICWMLIAHVWTSRMNELLILLNWETVCGYHCSNSYFSFDRWIRNHRWSESLLNDAAGTYL